jgi:arylsulfatase A-like enzyme
VKKTLLTLLLIAGALTLCAAEKMPNILIILADDMGYGDAGCNGCKDIPTPHIDSIAGNGARFTDGYVTAPQCAPSRSGLLSGRDQNRFGCGENSQLDRNGIPHGIKLFGDYLRPAGYRTGLVGKWHLGTMEGCHPLERGFDHFFGFLGGGSFYFPRENEKAIPKIFGGRKPCPVTGYLTDVFGGQAVDFINKSRGGPFFLFLSFNAPHAPLQAPEACLARFKHLAVDGEPGVLCGYTKKHIAHPRQVYAAMVSAMDDAIGRVLASLRQNHIEENTLIVFLSDNGGPSLFTSASNKPLRGVKGDVLEAGIRVPFVMQWKRAVPAGQTVEMAVSSLDLLPTALAAAGIDPPAGASFDGRNLLPVLTGRVKPAPRTLVWRFPFPPKQPDLHVWAVRQGDWKLVRESVRTEGANTVFGVNRTGLYQLREDIAEINDLSPKEPEKRRELQSIYDAWNATLPQPTAL